MGGVFMTNSRSMILNLIQIKEERCRRIAAMKSPRESRRLAVRDQSEAACQFLFIEELSIPGANVAGAQRDCRR